jgi:hypothetical protein
MNEVLLCQPGLSLQESITLVVAISALIFSGWQLLTQKRHNKLSVKPYLSIRHKWKDGVRTVSIKNVGLGPAVIFSHEFKYKNKVIPFEIAQHILDLADNFLGGGYYSGGKTIEISQVIEVGESVNILGLYWHEQHDEHEARDNVVTFLEEAEITMIYESMYGERQELKNRLVSPDDYHFY